MKFIQVRGSGDVFYYTDALAQRDDVDVIEAPDSCKPEDVKAALSDAQENLAREAELAAAEAEALLANAGLSAKTRVAARTRKIDRIEGLKVQRIEPAEQSNLQASLKAAALVPPVAPTDEGEDGSGE